MDVVGWLPPGVDDQCAYRATAALGVTAPPLSFYCLEAAPRGGLLLGYTGIDVREIRDGVRRLGEALADTSAGPAFWASLPDPAFLDGIRAPC